MLLFSHSYAGTVEVRQDQREYTVNLQEDSLTVSCTHRCVSSLDHIDPRMTIQYPGSNDHPTLIYPCPDYRPKSGEELSVSCNIGECDADNWREFSLRFLDIRTNATLLNNSVIHCGVNANNGSLIISFFTSGISYIHISNTVQSPTPNPTPLVSVTPSGTSSTLPPGCVYSSDVAPSLSTVADRSSIQPSLTISQTSTISHTAVESSLDTVRQTSESHSTTTDTSSARNTVMQSSAALSTTVLGTQPIPSASVSVTITVPPPSISKLHVILGAIQTFSGWLRESEPWKS